MKILCLINEECVISVDQVLQNAGFAGDCLAFHDVDEAKQYLAEHGCVDVVVCEDFVVTPDDGLDWARTLDSEGQKVVVLSDFEVKGLPRFSKSFAPIGGKSLLAMIHEIHAS